ncbi:HDOD domain-containing protein [Caldimonas thermodepolymerans]|jgi:Predicted signal transduction protein|uniref:Histidine kinase n=1 Tax=Caldimonas thermodepolymerans TaxID=215580 RepID=A0A2S5T3W6_9BURK|nr:HDOD domain-containing protein [Caldimonas thermodepolymerans]PPE69681.1 histidine kinase [Caldimonas thermodepolymerans]QPC31909.1 HDOD domain-containing protein [Caldimonas thermodepolymerans]RDI01573.1 HDOD domain-containing protein [Caldimonas thermodepolymerans]
MPVDHTLRSLNIDLPAQPAVLVQLSLLLAEEEVDFKAMGSLIEGDMTLAAAVLKALNSPIYGLRRQVRTVQQALLYLGSNEVAAITYEMGLRSVFPSAPELDALWLRANRRGMLMALMARRLGLDTFVAHSAGLFEECGKAVMFRHAPERYGPMLRDAPADDLLVLQEMQAFGVSHDALGAALCQTWTLHPAAVTCVRYHVVVQSGGTWPDKPEARPLCALSAVAHYLMRAPDALEAAVRAAATLGGLDEVRFLEAAQDAYAVLRAAEA